MTVHTRVSGSLRGGGVEVGALGLRAGKLCGSRGRCDVELGVGCVARLEGIAPRPADSARRGVHRCLVVPFMKELHEEPTCKDHVKNSFRFSPVQPHWGPLALPSQMLAVLADGGVRNAKSTLLRVRTSLTIHTSPRLKYRSESVLIHLNITNDILQGRSWDPTVERT